MVEWNLNDLLKGKSQEKIEQEVAALVDEFVTFRDELEKGVSASRLKEMIVVKEKIRSLLGSIEVYYQLSFSQNTKDEKALGKISYYDQLSTDISNKMVFFSLWFIGLEEKAAKEFITHEDLKEYSYYLEQLRKLKPYTKTEEIENIISIKSMTDSAFSNIYDIITNGFTFNFDGKEDVSRDEIRKHVKLKDVAKRKEAYESLLAPYEGNKVVLSEIYKSIVLGWYNEGVKIRGHESPIAIRDIRNDIESEAVQALFTVTRKNISLFNEYFKLKHDINQKLGAKYPNNRYHIYTPFEGKTDKKYEYEEAKKIVLKLYKDFDQRFHDHAKIIFEKGHVHSHPKKNKRSGAFCLSFEKETIPYILLNHNDTVESVFTMAHEFGHGIHALFSTKQVDLLAHASLPMCETASVFGEMLLAQKFLHESQSNNEKIGILMEQLDSQWATIIRQIYFVLFEIEAHESIRDGATVEDLDKKYLTLLKEQFGDMQIPECFKHEWVYIPHIYHSPFYCYAYAWGNLLVLALYDMYRKEGKSFIEKYVTLLESGGSKKAIDMLEPLGIDPKDESFWQRGFDIIREEVKLLKELYEKDLST